MEVSVIIHKKHLK